MTLKSKNLITSLFAGVLSLVGYLIYALSSVAPESSNLQSWAILIIVALGIAIGLQVIVHIIFYIVAHIGIAAKTGDPKAAERTMKAEMKDDERGKQIDLKTRYIGYLFFGLGFVSALVALAFGAIPLLALHLVLGSCFIGGFVEGVISIYYNERK
ncbi:hypothetical protein FACS1894211_02110 [Clostridia bacterium]|nr:hypothetical protein FACS1894211_02110 [Clostridia bacterium]